jgi:heptosyltransferase-2
VTPVNFLMKIAVFLPNWIGDVVMATPALRALRQHFGDAHIIGVMRPYVAGVLQGAPWLDRQIHLDTKGSWSQRWPLVAAKLRRERPDLAVLFPNSFRTGLVAWLAGCRKIAGYRRYGRGWMLTTALEPACGATGRLKPSPIIDAYNALVYCVGCPDPGYRMELFTTAEDEQAADVIWERTGLGNCAEVICLNPGAAFGSSKYWDLEYCARLAQDLVDVRGSGVLVLCGPQEADMARNIARLANRPAVHALADICSGRAVGVSPLMVANEMLANDRMLASNRSSAKNQGAYAPRSPKLSLGLTKACVRRADLLITTDSGPRHFAAAFSRPVVTLFGPTHIPWTETYYVQAIHLQKKVECGPCQLRVCPLDHRCMKLLRPEEVHAAAAQLLARFPPVKTRKAS